MPCGMAASQEASRPDVLTYMATSRFGPALLSSLAEQVLHPSSLIAFHTVAHQAPICAHWCLAFHLR